MVYNHDNSGQVFMKWLTGKQNRIYTDLCGVIKDATHYLFHCIKYFDERQVFNDTVRVF